MKKTKKSGNHRIDTHKKKVIKDKIHWTCMLMDSYDKIYNFCVSARGPAKTTVICWKIYKEYVHHHNHALILRRRPVDITEGYVMSIARTINKFLPVHKRISLYYNKGDLNKGQADIYLDEKKTQLFFRIQALSLPSERAKSNMIPDVAIIWFDEFIPNETRQYLGTEVTLFKDLYGTYSREFTKYEGRVTKCWFTGNPYTLFNPFFTYLGIPLADIKPGAVLVGKNYVLQFPVISPELKAFILKSNPTLLEDNEYTQYALNGIAINDVKYKIAEKPQGFKLKYVFRIGGTYLLAWKDNMGVNMLKDKWYIESSQKEPDTNKTIWAIDFDNLVTNTALVTTQQRVIMMALRDAIGRRAVTYSSVTAGVLIENLYKAL